jgi:hypothetical protein
VIAPLFEAIAAGEGGVRKGEETEGLKHFVFNYNKEGADSRAAAAGKGGTPAHGSRGIHALVECTRA